MFRGLQEHVKSITKLYKIWLLPFSSVCHQFSISPGVSTTLTLLSIFHFMSLSIYIFTSSIFHLISFHWWQSLTWLDPRRQNLSHGSTHVGIISHMAQPTSAKSLTWLDPCRQNLSHGSTHTGKISHMAWPKLAFFEFTFLLKLFHSNYSKLIRPFHSNTLLLAVQNFSPSSRIVLNQHYYYLNIDVVFHFSLNAAFQSFWYYGLLSF
jgi:hypothetical protein